MRRRAFLGGAAAGIAAGTVTAPAIAQSQPGIQWRMASSFPKSLDTIYGASEAITRRVADITDGRFQIRLFAADEIVPGLQVLDAVQKTTVECGHTASYYYVDKDPAFAFATALPFGLNARQQAAWMYHGGGRQAMAALFKDYQCVQIPAGNTGAQMGGWFRKEIKSVADLQGLRMRVSGLGGQVLARLGVITQQIGGGEIYQALERGAVDAAEWVGPYDDEKLALNKAARYYYYPGWWEGGPQLSVIVNAGKWDILPKPYKAALELACAESNVDMLARYDALNPDALRRVVAGGTELRAFPRAVLEAAQKAAFELYDQLAATSRHFQRIYGPWLKFRTGQFLWFRIAEMSYDNFVFTNPARPATRKK